jgi:hypothetical protein
MGPMSDEELAWMRRVGACVHERTRLRSGGMKLADRLMNFFSGFASHTSEPPR